MASSNTPRLAPSIRSALSELRWRIRAYVLAEGLALAAVWVGLTFWIGLAIDYLPVLVWASEIPRPVRAGGLIVVAAVLAWILYHWVLRRVFVRLRDRSMALLLERRFRGFDDGLVTAVELTRRSKAAPAGQAAGYDANMLQLTSQRAEQQVSRVHLADIFNASPLIRKLLLAAGLLLPVAALYFVRPEMTRTWVNRFYLLQDVAWPRDTLVEVLGLQVRRDLGLRQGDQPGLSPFDERQSLKVAKGSSGTLRVRAKSRSGKEPPRYCTVYYRSADGVRSTVRMNKVGRLTDDGYQTYALASKPFQGILENLDFDVVANDKRLDDYQLQVVESPTVVGTQLRCDFPAYLVDEATSSWQPRDVQYVASGTQLPMGTRIVVQMRTSKPLLEAFCQAGEEAEPQPLKIIGETELQYEIPALQQTTTLLVTLRDTDNVESERPEKLVIGAVPDDPPELEVLHRGIGALVTPDVRIPVAGQVTDDYRVDRAWFEVQVNDQPGRQFPLPTPASGQLDDGMDFRAARAAEQQPLELAPGDRMAVTVMAADRFNLADAANIGSGVRLELEVVTPERLLSALDQRELAQRRVFEHVIEEMTASRDDLARVRRDAAGETAGLEPGELPTGDEPEDALDEETIQRRAEALRLLRVQQAGLQSNKSAQETLAVAAAFDDIILELNNNRVLNSQDRQERLEHKIAGPLLLIGETMFPELDRRLDELENSFGDADANLQASEKALAQVDDILAEMNKVLQDMLYIETYNELVETVRLILDEQEKIQTATKRQRVKGLEGLLD